MMHRFESVIAVCAAVTFVGFAVAGYLESKKAAELRHSAEVDTRTHR